MPFPVIIDTNFLTVPVQFGVDIFSEAVRVLERGVEFVILSSVLEEIKSKIESANRKEARMFRVSLDLAGRCRIVDVDDSLRNQPVDDQILDYVKSLKGALATNDKELRERASSEGVPVLFLRGKKHLALEGTVI